MKRNVLLALTAAALTACAGAATVAVAGHHGGRGGFSFHSSSMGGFRPGHSFRAGNIGRSYHAYRAMPRAGYRSGRVGNWVPRNYSHHHHRHNRFAVGFPYYAYYPYYDDDYGYGYGGGCGWLYRRAVVTHSPYWWRRYEACVGYY